MRFSKHKRSHSTGRSLRQKDLDMLSARQKVAAAQRRMQNKSRTLLESTLACLKQLLLLQVLHRLAMMTYKLACPPVQIRSSITSGQGPRILTGPTQVVHKSAGVFQASRATSSTAASPPELEASPCTRAVQAPCMASQRQGAA